MGTVLFFSIYGHQFFVLIYQMKNIHYASSELFRSLKKRTVPNFEKENRPQFFQFFLIYFYLNSKGRIR